MQEYQRITHPFGPLYDENSKLLILGSFPSVKSREQQFFYGHPQNRFWKVVAGVLEVPVPQTIEEKKTMLLQNRIALWDVIAECDIIGSSDSSIRNVVPTDLSHILECAGIRQIYTNGGTATKLFARYQKPRLGRDSVGLPSTSPANAAWSVNQLQESWRAALRENL
ncbi:MAG: DNA-deoxyinosine glycosylase [Lachnospiraceae bacterium]|nr:DNA-deoxyinosine glycosylase [Lachnospiraceae bacterium]